MLSEQNLTDLLRRDKSAQEYFKSLPIDTQLTLSHNFSDVYTAEELRKQVELIFHSGGMTM